MKLAFIGLGTMGGAMAANLQAAGHEVRAHDLRRVEGFKHWCASAAEAAQGCEHPVLLRVAADASHSYASESGENSELSDLWAFVAFQLGLRINPSP